jgi:hypothetical protein
LKTHITSLPTSIQIDELVDNLKRFPNDSDQQIRKLNQLVQSQYFEGLFALPPKTCSSLLGRVFADPRHSCVIDIVKQAFSEQGDHLEYKFSLLVELLLNEKETQAITWFVQHLNLPLTASHQGSSLDGFWNWVVQSFEENEVINIFHNVSLKSPQILNKLNAMGPGHELVIHSLVKKGMADALLLCLQAGANTTLLEFGKCSLLNRLIYFTPEDRAIRTLESLLTSPDIKNALKSRLSKHPVSQFNKDLHQFFLGASLSGNTLLHRAAREKNEIVLKELLQLGALPFQKNYQKKDAVDLIIEHWDPVKREAFFLSATVADETPLLFYAIRLGELDLIRKIFVPKKSEFLVDPATGWYPLHAVVASKDDSLLEFFYKQSCQLTVRSLNPLEGGITPLHLAIKEGWFQGVCWLATKETTNLRGPAGGNALHEAIHHQPYKAEFLEQLLVAEAEPKQVDKNFFTPLALAQSKVGSCAPLIIQILKRVSQPNEGDDQGNNAIHGAVLNNDFNSVDKLFKAGWSFKRNLKGDTALHLLCQKMGQTNQEPISTGFNVRDVIDNLKSRGFSGLNSLNFSGLTPLDCYLLAGFQKKMLNKLIDLGLQASSAMQGIQQGLIYHKESYAPYLEDPIEHSKLNVKAFQNLFKQLVIDKHFIGESFRDMNNWIDLNELCDRFNNLLQIIVQRGDFQGVPKQGEEKEKFYLRIEANLGMILKAFQEGVIESDNVRVALIEIAVGGPPGHCGGRWKVDCNDQRKLLLRPEKGGNSHGWIFDELGRFRAALFRQMAIDFNEIHSLPLSEPHTIDLFLFRYGKEFHIFDYEAGSDDPWGANVKKWSVEEKWRNRDTKEVILNYFLQKINASDLSTDAVQWLEAWTMSKARALFRSSKDFQLIAQWINHYPCDLEPKPVHNAFVKGLSLNEYLFQNRPFHEQQLLEALFSALNNSKNQSLIAAWNPIRTSWDEGKWSNELHKNLKKVICAFTLQTIAQKEGLPPYPFSHFHREIVAEKKLKDILEDLLFEKLRAKFLSETILHRPENLSRDGLKSLREDWQPRLFRLDDGQELKVDANGEYIMAADSLTQREVPTRVKYTLYTAQEILKECEIFKEGTAP